MLLYSFASQSHHFPAEVGVSECFDVPDVPAMILPAEALTTVKILRMMEMLRVER